MVLPHGGGQGARAFYDAASKRVLTLNPQAGLATLWRAADGARLQSIPQAPTCVTRYSPIRTAHWLPPAMARLGYGNGTSRRYVLKAHLEGNQNAIPAMAASADGRYAATCSFDGTVHLWECAHGRVGERIKRGANQYLLCGALQPDARTLATGDERLARLWRLPDLRPLQMLSSIARPVIHLAYAPDGRLGQ